MFISRALVQSLRVFGLAASVLLRQTPLGDSVSIVSPVLCYSQESSIAHKLLTVTTLSVREHFLVRWPCTCHLVGFIQTASAFTAAEITDAQGYPEIS